MLVRKKSGEIVKSAIKSTSSSNNNVKFNQHLDIMMFDGNESPLNISQKNSPISSTDTSPANSLVNSPNPFNMQSGQFKDDTLQYYISSHNINIGNTDTNAIYLKSINYYGNKLVGYVNCLNLDYEKAFQIKLTFNNWKSSILFNNNFTYVKSVGGYDEFKFEINLNICKDFELVINYKVNNQSFWDNNNGSNYKVLINKHQSFSSYDYFEDFDYYNLDDYNYNDYSYSYNYTDYTYPEHQDSQEKAEKSDKSDIKSQIDTSYVDTLLNRFVSSNDYNSILQNYCFYNEPTPSYSSLHDEISI